MNESLKPVGLSKKAGKVIDLYNGFTVAYGKDLEVGGKAAGLKGIYSTHCRFIRFPAVFI